MARPSQPAIYLGAACTAIVACVAIIAFARSNRPDTLPTIIIARIQTPHSGLLHIAEAKGYFKEAGVSVKMLTTPTGYDAITAIGNGSATLAAAAETPIARALDEGKHITVLATIFSSRSNSGIVARRDKGIVNPTDLTGRRIGVVFGTASHYLLETFLAFNSMPLDSVTLVPKDPGALVSAIMSGSVDAIACWNPYLAETRQDLGIRATTFSSQDFYAETYDLISTHGVAPSSGDSIVKVLRALVMAEDFVQSDPDDAIRIITRESHIDPVLFRKYWDPLDYQLSLSQSLLLSTENEAAWYLRRGMVQGDHVPDVLSAFNVDDMRRVKPAGVSIVK